MAKNNSKTPTKSADVENTPAAPMPSHRVLISDVADPIYPVVQVLEIVAPTYSDARNIAGELDDPCNPNKPGVAVRKCRLEEVLPYLRQGFSIRRDAWPMLEVIMVHTHLATRLDFYRRHPEYPAQRPEHFRELKGLSDADIMSEDWSVVSKPPELR